MSTAEVLGLGAIAGGTIFLGLPLGRLGALDARMRAFLSAIASGILLFLLWDVLSHAVDPIETSIEHSEWSDFAGFAAVFVVTLAAGLLSLIYYERWISRSHKEPLFGPGAASVDEFAARNRRRTSNAAQLCLLIAIGIGLHNFSEGLAIGQSAAADELSLAYALIIGFALHNSTEGFGIVAPLSGTGEMPNWGFLLLLGVIGGGPTFLGTAVGQFWTDDFLAVAFFGLAAGSILFVVNELLHMNYKSGFKEVATWGLLLGLLAGFVTDWVLVAVEG